MTATTAAQADHRELLLQAYAAYNSHDTRRRTNLAKRMPSWHAGQGMRVDTPAFTNYQQCPCA